MKKLISLTVSATLILSSLALTVDLPGKITTIDVVSAASDAAETPKTPTKTTETKKTPAVKTPTVKKSTPATKTNSKTTPKKTTKTPAQQTKQPAAVKNPVVKVTTPVKKTEAAPVKEQTKPAVPVYQDGVYVAYGNAYSKGTEGAKVTIKGGKVADIELLRTSPKLIDRDARYNYSGLWQAYETMKKNLKGKTREQAAEVDVVSGATRSSEGWKLSVDRAFARALQVKPEGQVYFEGEHMGVDPQGKYMVFVNYDKTKRLGVKVYPLNAKGEAIDESGMTAEQSKIVYTIAGELLYRGIQAVTLKGYEEEFKAAIEAYQDAEKNALVTNKVKYVDGFYSAYGVARDKGVERADVVIRNDKLVDVKLYRLGANLLDRGDTAFTEVVKANAPMVSKLLKNGSYIDNYDDSVDAISGATESSHSWNIAVERAFEKALKQPENKQKYYEGTFAGVDNQSKVLVLIDMKEDKVSNTVIHVFGTDGKLMKAESLSDSQAAAVSVLRESLTKNGVNTVIVAGQEELSLAAKAAYADALKNASKTQGNYRDGVFTAYGDAYDKGTNRADVTLRNGVIVGIELYRVGVNMVDRGSSAYPEVVKAIPILERDYRFAATKENAMKVDAVSGASSSSNSFKQAVDRAYKNAEITESYKTAYMNGIYAGVNADKSVYVMVTVEHNVPAKMAVYYLDSKGKIKTEDQLTEDEKSVKAEIEIPAEEGKMHKYAYRPAAFGDTDSKKAVSGKVLDAVKAALEFAGR